MRDDRIRVGIIGAGANTRLRHIPGFRAVDSVEILGVVNRSRESSQRVADEYDIPRVYDHWSQLLADPEIDAVQIGTWPDLHCEITCAALEAGKHVLTEARMARNLAEAREMLVCSQRHSDLVTQIVPSPFGLVHHDYVTQCISDGKLGDVRELVVIGANSQFLDASQPLHWRQDRAISGRNILAMGILHETAIRWARDPIRVFAQQSTFLPTRPAADGTTVAVTVPDSVQIVTELAGGGRGVYHLSGVDRFGPGLQIHLYGSEGTLKLKLAGEEQLLEGFGSDEEMKLVSLPEELRGGWRVEAEFIGAIRREETIRFTDFATGVRYMEFTEAVGRSCEQRQPIDLPLE